VTNVRVLGITMGSGTQAGEGIRVESLGGPHVTVNITGSTISGFQKNGVVARGNVTMNVTNSTIGPPDSILNNAQNTVQFGGGAGGSVTGSTVEGASFLPGHATATAILLIGAAPVTITGNTITGDADVGIFVGTDTWFSVPPAPTSGTVISNNKIQRTGP